MKRLLLLLSSHAAMLAFGLGMGIYLLTILTAPALGETGKVQPSTAENLYPAEFRSDLKHSDTFCWGEGAITISRHSTALAGHLTPGPITSSLCRWNSSKPKPTTSA
ncbi:MAG: hypothetical protein ACK59Y_06595 [Betaproteobacteria bacterium]